MIIIKNRYFPCFKTYKTGHIFYNVPVSGFPTCLDLVNGLLYVKTVPRSTALVKVFN